MTDTFFNRPLCGFEALPGTVSQSSGGAIARWKHLFPFRTEQLSTAAPMVLGGQPPGRVGRRRFLLTKQDTGPPEGLGWAAVRAAWPQAAQSVSSLGVRRAPITWTRGTVSRADDSRIGCSLSLWGRTRGTGFEQFGRRDRTPGRATDLPGARDRSRWP